MKKFLSLLVVLSICTVLFAGCMEAECDHEWEDATCEEPKTCSECGDTRGDELGHDWQDATCTEAQICLRCEKVGTEALGHTPGNEVIEPDIVNAEYQVSVSCETCAEVLSVEEDRYTTFIENKLFIFSAEQFMERLEDAFGQLSGCNLTVDTEMYNGRYTGSVYSGYTLVATIYFYDENDVAVTKGTQNNLYNVGFVSDDAEVSAFCLLGFIMAADPDVTRTDASAIAERILDTINNYSGYTYNNINYVNTYDSGSYVLLVYSD